MKVPAFPDKVTVESYRNWLRDFGRYVERHVDFPGAEHLFKSIRHKIDVPMLAPDAIAIGKLLDKAQENCMSNVVYRDVWMKHECEKDLFEVLEFV